jgi:hypothetical protein
VPLGITLFFTTPEESEFIEAIGRDISLTGMFVETSMPVDFDSDVIVHVTLPNSDGESQISARVRWKTNEGMGLQFGSLSARETYLITEYVRKYEERPVNVASQRVSPN